MEWYRTQQRKEYVRQNILQRNNFFLLLLHRPPDPVSSILLHQDADQYGWSGTKGDDSQNPIPTKICLISLLEQWTSALENNIWRGVLRSPLCYVETRGPLFLQCDHVCQGDRRVHFWHCEASSSERGNWEAFHCWRNWRFSLLFSLQSVLKNNFKKTFRSSRLDSLV